jgi:hypothetical protein
MPWTRGRCGCRISPSSARPPIPRRLANPFRTCRAYGKGFIRMTLVLLSGHYVWMGNSAGPVGRAGVHDIASVQLPSLEQIRALSWWPRSCTSAGGPPRAYT